MKYESQTPTKPTVNRRFSRTLSFYTKTGMQDRGLCKVGSFKNEGIDNMAKLKDSQIYIYIYMKLIYQCHI